MCEETQYSARVLYCSKPTLYEFSIVAEHLYFPNVSVSFVAYKLNTSMDNENKKLNTSFQSKLHFAAAKTTNKKLTFL